MTAFEDLLSANKTYASTHDLAGFDGIAHAGVAIVTCMDSRIDPLALTGLSHGDAKIIRVPGGRVTDEALIGVVLGVTLLQVNRVLIVEHTRCAVATSTEEQLQERITAFTGKDAAWMHLHVVHDQEATIRADVHRVRSHPLVPADVAVGGFIYDVDTGLLDEVVEA